jgi:hypothetical protein
LYTHTVNNDMTKARDGTVEINMRNPGTMVAHIYNGAFDLQQVQLYRYNGEPLSVYK